MTKEFLEVGKIVGVHGLKGEVRVDPWCDGPEFVCGFSTLYTAVGKALPVLSARVQKNVAVLLLKDVRTPEEAEAMRGTVLFIRREDAHLPEGVFFIQDLLGLKVVDRDSGAEYGVISDVLRTGANDVYAVKNGETEWLIPVIPDVVEEILPEEGLVRVNTGIVKGLFEA